MGAINGPITIRRYRARPLPPAAHLPMDIALRGVVAHQFVPIDVAGDVVRSVGWVTIQNPDRTTFVENGTDFGWSASTLMGLSMRIDTLRPPPQAVRKVVAEILGALGRKPNKAEEEAAKVEATRRLRLRYMPTMKVVDVVWDRGSNVVCAWSHAKSDASLLGDLFRKSFNHELVPIGPGQVACIRVLIGDKTLVPCPEMIGGFPGLPGRPVDGEDDA